MIIDCENEQTIRESMEQQGIHEKDIDEAVELVKTIKDAAPSVLEELRKEEKE